MPLVIWPFLGSLSGTKLQIQGSLPALGAALARRRKDSHMPMAFKASGLKLQAVGPKAAEGRRATDLNSALATCSTASWRPLGT